MMRINKYYYYYFDAAMLVPDYNPFVPLPQEKINSIFPGEPSDNENTVGWPIDHIEVDKELVFEDEVNLDLCDVFFSVAIEYSPLKLMIDFKGYSDIKHLIEDLMALMSESNLEVEPEMDRLASFFPFIDYSTGTLFPKLKNFKQAFCTRVAADSKSSDKEVWEFVLPYHNQMISKKDLIYSAALAKFDQK